MTVYEKIKAMQPTEENDVWMVGEQLADICRAEGQKVEELVSNDLDVAGMDLKAVAEKLRTLANEKRKKVKGNCVVITPAEADAVIRKFYGIPAREENKITQAGQDKAKRSGDVVDLFDMI